MKIITWDGDSVEETIDMIDDMLLIENTIQSLKQGYLQGNITTERAIGVCKAKLFGEYHGILVKENAMDLDDAEIYLLTWDGEASDGGMMHRIDYPALRKIAMEQLFTETAD